VKFITNDIDAQSTTSTTLEECDEAETSKWQEGETQSWPEFLIFEQKPTEIGI